MSTRAIVRPLLVGLTLLVSIAAAAPASASGWGSVRTLTPHGFTAPQHAVAVDGSSAEMVYLDGGIRVRHSTDGGSTWGAAKLIESTSPSKQAGLTQIAMSGAHVVVLYERQDALQTDFRLYVRRSADGGSTWSSRVLIAKATYWAVLASASVAITGKSVVVAWTDGTTGAIRSRHSSDGGSHWDAPRKLGSTNVQGSSYDGFVQVTAAAGHVYVTWLPDLTTQGMATGVVMRRSADGGATFAARQWLTADALAGGGSVRLAASGARLLAVYQRAAGRMGQARTSDGGRTIHTQDITNGSGYPQTALAIHGATGRLALIGQDGRIHLRSSSDSGAHWSPVSDVATPGSDASGLAVAVGNAGTVVVWRESDLFSTRAVRSRFKG